MRRGALGEDTAGHPLAADLAGPTGRATMPRLHAPGCTVHVVGRCNNREFGFTEAEDFGVVIAHLGDMARTSGGTLYGYTWMANHVHLLLKAPLMEPVAHSPREFFRETTCAWHRARGHRCHFWERRYRSGLIKEDLSALAALRYVDRNPLRATLVEDPTTYAWSSCAAYALSASNPLISYHPSYLALSPYPAVRQRHYRALLAPSGEAQADARDPRWTSERAVGSPAFLKRFLHRRPRRRIRSPDEAKQ